MDNYLLKMTFSVTLALSYFSQRTTSACCERSCLKPLDNTVLLPKNCREIQLQGAVSDGIYTIYPISTTEPVNVHCDLTTEGGGWTVFQRRQDGSVDFYRTWNEYRDGFGTPYGEMWLGNDLIHALTKYTAQELRIDMTDWEGNKAYAQYSGFYIGEEIAEFKLSLGPFSGGPAGDGMSAVNNQNFTTKDSDNDVYAGNCATLYPSAFWFSACFSANPNGIYRPSNATDGYAKGVIWRQWKEYYYSLKSTEMKMRPVQ